MVVRVPRSQTSRPGLCQHFPRKTWQQARPKVQNFRQKRVCLFEEPGVKVIDAASLAEASGPVFSVGLTKNRKRKSDSLMPVIRLRNSDLLCSFAHSDSFCWFPLIKHLFFIMTLMWRSMNPLSSMHTQQKGPWYSRRPATLLNMDWSDPLELFLCSGSY